MLKMPVDLFFYNSLRSFCYLFLFYYWRGPQEGIQGTRGQGWQLLVNWACSYFKTKDYGPKDLKGLPKQSLE